MEIAPSSTEGTILCPLCGAQIKPNPANMCFNCIKSQVDITAGIPKQLTVFHCRGCNRYQKPPWIFCELESRELLALLLKKVKGLGKEVKLVDAGFIWTEAHSRRIKLKLTIQKEVFGSLILQQQFQVEFVVSNLQCPDCQQSYTDHVWNANVQVRQKVKHKRTFFYLEQLLLKHSICDKAMGVKEMPDGLDFYFSRRTDAQHLIDFLKGCMVVKAKEAKKLISQDDHNNTKNYKYTLYGELAPVCKDDLCVLDPKLCQLLGGISPLVLIYKITNHLTVVDPITLKLSEIVDKVYWRYPFTAKCSMKSAVEYMVLDVEIDQSGPRVFNKQTKSNEKLLLAEVTIARMSDLGVNDTTFTVMTHLGNLLRAGDTCIGYDLQTTGALDDLPRNFRQDRIPDVILIRKTYPNRKERRRKRTWKLQQIANKEGMEMKPSELAKQEQDYETFLQDVEEDPSMRKKINLFKDGKRTETTKGDDEDSDDGFPEITDLLDEMTVSKAKMSAVDLSSSVGMNDDPITFG